jgi:2-amino-4-hydroxy-6-hydroxymethyldihydropteridine diphosphokinase
MALKKVYLLLGGNLSNTEQLLSDARELLELSAGSIHATSSIYQSQAWGFESDDLFLNQVVSLFSIHEPLQLLDIILNIEKQLGRVRHGEGYSSRSIDIDILFYNDQIINEPELIIPHPRLHQRNFTLVPLNEIAPNLIHPLLKQTVRQLLENSEDRHLATPFTR